MSDSFNLGGQVPNRVLELENGQSIDIVKMAAEANSAFVLLQTDCGSVGIVIDENQDGVDGGKLQVTVVSMEFDLFLQQVQVPGLQIPLIINRTLGFGDVLIQEDCLIGVIFED